MADGSSLPQLTITSLVLYKTGMLHTWNRTWCQYSTYTAVYVWLEVPFEATCLFHISRFLLPSEKKGKTSDESWRKESKIWIWGFTSASGTGNTRALHRLTAQHSIQAAPPESSPINHSLLLPLSNICVHLGINLNRLKDSCQIRSFIRKN